jgi:hypothetical protein
MRRRGSRYLAVVVISAIFLVGCGQASDGSVKARPGPTTSDESSPSRPSVGRGPVAPATPRPPSGPGILHGRVVDRSGYPIAALSLLVVGHSLTATDAEGTFAVPEVTPPYDVALLDDSTGVATIYTQLTRMDPQLTNLTDRFGDPGESRSAELTGSIDGGVPLQQRWTQMGLAWASPGVVGGDFIAQTPYAFPFYWNGPSTITGTLHALQWMADGDLVTGYLGYATRTGVTVQSGGSVGNIDFGLVPPEVTTISGTVLAPSGFILFGRTFDLTFDDGASFLLGGDSGDTMPDATFSVPVPAGIGATCLVTARALEVIDYDRSVYRFTQVKQAGVLPGRSDLTLELPFPALPVHPVDGETLDATAELGWTALPDAVYQVRVGAETTGARSYILVSGSTHARVPELPQHWGLQQGGHYVWYVTALGPYPRGIDEFAGREARPADSRFLTWSNDSHFVARP